MLLVDFSPDLNRDESVRLTEELQRRVEALPGVTGTTVALRFPFGLSGSGMTHKVFVPQISGADSEGATINYAPVAARYFEVLGTRILRGRAIDRHDLETHARVLVINQQMAARFWANQDPVGQLLRLDKPDGQEYEVIGVAENGKYNDIQEATMPYFFLPMQPLDYGEVEMAIKTAADPASLAGPLRQALRALNPNAPIVQLVTLRDHMREALYIQSATSRLIGTLGMLGLVLVAVGVYGLMSFVVGKRTQEIGIRLALGSQRSAIFRLILRYALRLSVAGIVLGMAASFAAGRALRSLLVGVAPSDPIVLAIAATLLLSMTLMAALVPASKAVRVNPVVALRDE
jgi:putative ABC transport system permease protein